MTVFRPRQYDELDRSEVRAIRSAVSPEYDREPTGWLAANQLDAPQNAPYRYVVDDQSLSVPPTPPFDTSTRNWATDTSVVRFAW